MPQEQTPGSRSDPSFVDDPLAGLRKLAGLAKDMGVTDVASFAAMLENARADGRGADVLKPLKSFVEQLAGSSTTKGDGPSPADPGERLTSMVAGRNGVEERRLKVELALLRRIEELSRTASVDDVAQLATAYARLRAGTAVDPGDAGTVEPAPDQSATG